LTDPADSNDVMDRLITFYENVNNTNWSIDHLSDKFKEKKFNGIVTFEIPINRLEGKFKLSQNRTIKDRLGAIKGLISTGSIEAKKLAQLMKNMLPKDD
jgi:transcriptional regulator